MGNCSLLFVEIVAESYKEGSCTANWQQNQISSLVMCSYFESLSDMTCRLCAVVFTHTEVDYCELKLNWYSLNREKFNNFLVWKWQHLHGSMCCFISKIQQQFNFDVIAGHAGPSWAGWFSKLWANWSQFDNLTLVACVCMCICSGRVVLYIFNFHSFISRIQYILIRKQFPRWYIRGEVTEGIFSLDKIDLRLWQYCFQGRRKIRRSGGKWFAPLLQVSHICKCYFRWSILLIGGLNTNSFILEMPSMKVLWVRFSLCPKDVMYILI